MDAVLTVDITMNALQVKEGSSYEKENFPLSSLQVERP
jgi:hypothetical protein